MNFLISRIVSLSHFRIFKVSKAESYTAYPYGVAIEEFFFKSFHNLTGLVEEIKNLIYVLAQ